MINMSEHFNKVNMAMGMEGMVINYDGSMAKTEVVMRLMMLMSVTMMMATMEYFRARSCMTMMLIKMV